LNVPVTVISTPAAAAVNGNSRKAEHNIKNAAILIVFIMDLH